MSDDLSDDGYPSEAALERIRKWEFSTAADFPVLWEFARGLWIYPDRFCRVDVSDKSPVSDFLADADWYVSTGGWSGHESVIDALSDNYLFWWPCWRLHRAGGHYWFKIEGHL